MTLITKTELKAFREDFQKDVKTGKLWKSSVGSFKIQKMIGCM